MTSRIFDGTFCVMSMVLGGFMLWLGGGAVIAGSGKVIP